MSLRRLYDNLSSHSNIVRIVRKIDYRLLPITALIYLLCYIDRSNIGKCQP